MWLENRCRRKGEYQKLQAEFQGPCTVVKSWANHTYQIKRHGQTSIQNECSLNRYRLSPEKVGRAPVTLKPSRRPNMRGAIRRRRRTPSPEPWLLPLLPSRPVNRFPSQTVDRVVGRYEWPTCTSVTILIYKELVSILYTLFVPYMYILLLVLFLWN